MTDRVQALILATRPLLFSYLQKRLSLARPLRVSALRGARSLIRVCVSSAQHCLSILELLQLQSLLESWLPFDREAAYSSALVLVVAHVVDHTLIPDRQSRLDIAFGILDEIVLRGNILAEKHKRELDQIISTIDVLNSAAIVDNTTGQYNQGMCQMGEAHQLTASSLAQQDMQGMANMNDFDAILGEWNSEDELSGERLLVLAESLDLDQMQWFANEGHS